MHHKVIITMQLKQQNKTIHTRQQNGQQVNKSQIYDIYMKMPFPVITRTLFCLSSNLLSINSTFVTMPYKLLHNLWCINHIYLYSNSNMHVSFNKIIYIMLVYFVSCYLSLAMSLSFFLNVHCILCNKNSGLVSLHFYGKYKI